MEVTREQILTSAGRLFRERGIRAVGIIEIIDEAGCGKSVLYRHFPSKNDLVAAYLQAFGEARERATQAAIAGLERMPSGALVALTREIADRVSDPDFAGCALRGYLREVRDQDSEPGRIAMAEVARARAHIDGLVDSLGTDDPEVLAARIWLVLEGLYASVPYPDRAGAASTAVGLVQDLLASA